MADQPSPRPQPHRRRAPTTLTAVELAALERPLLGVLGLG